MSRPTCHKFFSHQLNLQKSNGFFSKKTIIFQDSRGVQHFPGGGGGVQLFPGGGFNCLFPIRTQITCDFPGGGLGPPVSFPDPHMKTHSSDVLFMV